MKIKIYKNSLDDSHSLYMNDKKRENVIADGIETTCSAERFRFMVLNMVSDWEKEMIDPFIIDGLEYKIVIKENDQETVYTFKNKFPDDIHRLEMLIENIVETIRYVR